MASSLQTPIVVHASSSTTVDYWSTLPEENLAVLKKRYGAFFYEDEDAHCGSKHLHDFNGDQSLWCSNMAKNTLNQWWTAIVQALKDDPVAYLANKNTIYHLDLPGGKFLYIVLDANLTASDVVSNVDDADGASPVGSVCNSSLLNAPAHASSKTGDTHGSLVAAAASTISESQGPQDSSQPSPSTCSASKAPSDASSKSDEEEEAKKTYLSTTPFPIRLTVIKKFMVVDQKRVRKRKTYADGLDTTSGGAECPTPTVKRRKPAGGGSDASLGSGADGQGTLSGGAPKKHHLAQQSCARAPTGPPRGRGRRGRGRGRGRAARAGQIEAGNGMTHPPQAPVPQSFPALEAFTPQQQLAIQQLFLHAQQDPNQNSASLQRPSARALPPGGPPGCSQPAAPLFPPGGGPGAAPPALPLGGAPEQAAPSVATGDDAAAALPLGGPPGGAPPAVPLGGDPEQAAPSVATGDDAAAALPLGGPPGGAPPAVPRGASAGDRGPSKKKSGRNPIDPLLIGLRDEGIDIHSEEYKNIVEQRKKTKKKERYHAQKAKDKAKVDGLEAKIQQLYMEASELKKIIYDKELANAKLESDLRELSSHQCMHEASLADAAPVGNESSSRRAQDPMSSTPSASRRDRGMTAINITRFGVEQSAIYHNRLGVPEHKVLYVEFDPAAGDQAYVVPTAPRGAQPWERFLRTPSSSISTPSPRQPAHLSDQDISSLTEKVRKVFKGLVLKRNAVADPCHRAELALFEKTQNQIVFRNDAPPTHPSWPGDAPDDQSENSRSWLFAKQSDWVIQKAHWQHSWTSDQNKSVFGLNKLDLVERTFFVDDTKQWKNPPAAIVTLGALLFSSFSGLQKTNDYYHTVPKVYEAEWSHGATPPDIPDAGFLKLKEPNYSNSFTVTRGSGEQILYVQLRGEPTWVHLCAPCPSGQSSDGPIAIRFLMRTNDAYILRDEAREGGILHGVLPMDTTGVPTLPHTPECKANCRFSLAVRIGVLPMDRNEAMREKASRRNASSGEPEVAQLLTEGGRGVACLEETFDDLVDF